MSGFDLRKQSQIDKYINFEGYGFIKGLLFDLGSYPAAIASSGKIFGELYQVSDPLKLLSCTDAVEQYFPQVEQSSTYLRREVQVTLKNGESKKAWSYYYSKSLSDAVLIADGDYRSHVAKSSS